MVGAFSNALVHWTRARSKVGRSSVDPGILSSPSSAPGPSQAQTNTRAYSCASTLPAARLNPAPPATHWTMRSGATSYDSLRYFLSSSSRHTAQEARTVAPKPQCVAAVRDATPPRPLTATLLVAPPAVAAPPFGVPTAAAPLAVCAAPLAAEAGVAWPAAEAAGAAA